MSKHQSKIEKLIAEFAPNGVEFRALGELGDFYGGLTGKSKGDFSGGNAKFITYVNIYNNIAVDTDSKNFVKVDANERQNRVEYGDALFTGSSETPNDVGMSSVLTKKVDEPLYLNSFCFGFRFHDKDLFLPGFTKYLFRDEQARKQIAGTASGVTRFNISKKRFAKIKIPVPPLDIQEEVVRILDNFTELASELASELEARRKQYDHYRTQLLTFSPDSQAGTERERERVRWAALSEITMTTSNIKWKEAGERAYKYVDLTSVDRSNHQITETIEITSENAPSRAQKIIKKDDVIFATTRPTLQRYAIIKDDFDGQVASTGYCVLRAKTDEVLPKWIYYSISTQVFNDYAEQNQEGSAYPAISDSKVKSFKIPVPSLDEQKRIVSILDIFDALVSDISIGLPAEINARRSQYEYYRGKLLTFNEYVAV